MRRVPIVATVLALGVGSLAMGSASVVAVAPAVRAVAGDLLLTRHGRRVTAVAVEVAVGHHVLQPDHLAV